MKGSCTISFIGPKQRGAALDLQHRQRPVPLVGHRQAQVLVGGAEPGEHVHERVPAGGLLGGDDAAGALQATDGCSSTSGTASRPKPMPKPASLPAAHSRFFARSFPSGATSPITPRANAAACGDSDDGCHRAR